MLKLSRYQLRFWWVIIYQRYLLAALFDRANMHMPEYLLKSIYKFLPTKFYYWIRSFEGLRHLFKSASSAHSCEFFAGPASYYKHLLSGFELIRDPNALSFHHNFNHFAIIILFENIVHPFNSRKWRHFPTVSQVICCNYPIYINSPIC